jgi:hypothetical protein
MIERKKYASRADPLDASLLCKKIRTSNIEQGILPIYKSTEHRDSIFDVRCSIGTFSYRANPSIAPKQYTIALSCCASGIDKSIGRRNWEGTSEILFLRMQP